MSLGYGLNFYVPDKEGFITGLVAYVRGTLTTDGNVRIKQGSDSLFIGYETMYMYIYLSNYENSCRIVEDRENVKINFDMTVYLYKGKYRQGVIDIAKIVKYYLSNYRGDCVWSEEGTTVLVRRDGKISFESETNFPVRCNQAEEFYSIDYKIVYKGMEFELENMEKKQLQEMVVDIYTCDINIAEQYSFSPKYVTYVKKIPISKVDKLIEKKVWTTDENKGEIYTNDINIAEQYGFSPHCGTYVKKIPLSEVEKLIETKVWITGEKKDKVVVHEKDIISFIENHIDSI